MPEIGMEEFKEMTTKMAAAIDTLDLTTSQVFASMVAILAATVQACPSLATTERYCVGLIMLTEQAVAHREALAELEKAKEENRVC